MTNDELLSKNISYLRFPLTVGVVFIHFSLANGLDVHGVRRGLENPEWYFFIVNFISVVLARIGVPLFFIISGFLFFYHKEFSKDTYKQNLKTRVRTLLIPFLLWNVIAIIFNIWRLNYFLPSISSFYHPVEIHLSLTRIINTFLCHTDSIGIFVGKFTFTMLHIPENNPYAMLALYFTVPILSIVFCFTLYMLLKKYTPKVCNLLTGGR
ncbi:MAG: acyltransferase [Prevotella sp.]|nr:acyltransferase [Prevotella sp.]